MIPVTHYFTSFESLGGVQSLLRRHVDLDAKWGLDSNIVAFFDPDRSSNAGVHGLGLTWKSSIQSSRGKFADRLANHRRGLAVYNNFWGVPFFADLDRAERRIGVLHVYPEVLRDYLGANSDLVDGVLCVSQPLKTVVHQLLPELEPSRVAILPLPISRCPLNVERQPFGDRPIVLGFNGRLVKEQKRVDRLPKLIRVLDQAGLKYRLELLGDGPDQSWLERQFKGNSRVCLHGRQSGEAYWKVLASWDAIVFTSDFEGLPLSLLEALSAGALPIYPRINSGGEFYAGSVASEFLYDTEDFQHVAAVARKILSANAAQIQSWRARCRELAEQHAGDSYHEVFAAFARQIWDAPRISSARHPRRRFYLSDHCPFGVLVRAYLRGFYRRNDR